MTKHRSFFVACCSLLLLAYGTACNQHQNKPQPKKGMIPDITAMQDSVAVIPFQEGNGWGYDIKVGSHTFIHQPVIPYIPGWNPFVSKEEALRVGEKMVEKMKKNPGSLPAINKQELLEMKITGVK